MATNEDPSITSSDDNYIQIVTHQLPGPVDKRSLYEYAKGNKWDEAKRYYYDDHPDMMGIPLTAGGDTALHVAVSAYRVTFVKELVKLMKPEDLELRNSDGNTAFCIAAILGHSYFLEILGSENERLPLIPGQDGMLPVHLAALTGLRRIVRDLSSADHLGKMDPKDVKRLFFMTIRSSLYDVATELLVKYPDLATSRDEENLTAFHVLAGKSSRKLIGKADKKEKYPLWAGHELLKKLCSCVRQLEYKQALELITTPVLFDAVKSGNDHFVKLLLWSNPAFLTRKYSESDGLTLLHFAALYRQQSLLEYILRMERVDLIIRAVDKDHNNVLHFAAKQPVEERSESSSLTPNVQMERELLWFKEVKKIVPPELRIMTNRNGLTPKDIFYDSHKGLCKEVETASKGIANSGMLVATIVATVVFAAALSVPYDKTNNAGFVVFLLSNAVALFTSSASVVTFFTILTTPRFRESDFIIIINRILSLGLIFLFISLAAMIMAFAAASFFIFDHKYKWVAIVVASMGPLPILLFGLFRWFGIDYFWPTHRRLSKFQ